MEISESIDEGVLEPLYWKTIRSDVNCIGRSRQKIREADKSQTQSETSESAVKRKKYYVD